MREAGRKVREEAARTGGSHERGADARDYGECFPVLTATLCTHLVFPLHPYLFVAVHFYIDVLSVRPLAPVFVCCSLFVFCCFISEETTSIFIFLFFRAVWDQRHLQNLLISGTGGAIALLQRCDGLRVHCVLA